MSAPLTPEEARCIKEGDTLFVEKLSVHGTYKDGTPFVREYDMGVQLHQTDRIKLNYILSYPDPLFEALNRTLQ